MEKYYHFYNKCRQLKISTYSYSRQDCPSFPYARSIPACLFFYAIYIKILKNKISCVRNHIPSRTPQWGGDGFTTKHLKA